MMEEESKEAMELVGIENLNFKGIGRALCLFAFPASTREDVSLLKY
jgi:hypothetical protein